MDWIDMTFKHLMGNSEVLRNSVTVFGSTFHGSTSVCEIERFQSCMNKAIDNIDCLSDDKSPFAT